MTGRRRIGTTTRIQRAIQAAGSTKPIVYVQIPDLGPAGVLSTVADTFDTFGLVRDVPTFDEHVRRFLEQFPAYARWKIERVCLAPQIPAEVRKTLESSGYLAQDLNDLTAGL